MSPDLEIREATLWDAVGLAGAIRPNDRAEVHAITGERVFDAVAEGLLSSAEAWTAAVDRVVMAMWGVQPVGRESILGPRIGVVWLLTTELVDRYPSLFWRQSKAQLRALFDRWDLLTNVVDARYAAALRWVHRLGFRLSKPEPMGVLGLDFVSATARLEDLQWVHR